MSKLIALDDPHGMNTPGKRTPPLPDGTVIRENQFGAVVTEALDIALRRCGFKTMFTAPEINDVGLDVRVDRANKVGADAFVSNHYDAFRGVWDQTKGGYSIHVHPGKVESRKLAESVHAEIKSGSPDQVDRGIRESNFAVTRETHMPSILIENGFMDVTFEAKKMLNQAFISARAEQECKGVCKYFGVAYVQEKKGDETMTEDVRQLLRTMNKTAFMLVDELPVAEQLNYLKVCIERYFTSGGK